MENNDQSVTFNLYAASRFATKAFRDASGGKHTFQSLLVLKVLADSDSQITMNTLSDTLMLDSSAVSTLVSRMEKKGWVVRHHGEDDRRTVFVGISYTGLDEYAYMKPVYEMVSDNIQKATGDTTAQALVSLPATLQQLINKKDA